MLAGPTVANSVLEGGLAVLDFSDLWPMFGEVEPEKDSVKWATALAILFRSLWQDGLEVRER